MIRGLLRALLKPCPDTTQHADKAPNQFNQQGLISAFAFNLSPERLMPPHNHARIR